MFLMQNNSKNILVIICMVFLVFAAFGRPALAACDAKSQLCNVQVLIEQYQIIDKTPPQTSTLNNIIQKSPDLTQLHLRIWGDLNINQGGGNPQSVAQQISNVQLPKTGAVTLGFHPDNYKSADTWTSCIPYSDNCTKPCDSSCGATCDKTAKTCPLTCDLSDNPSVCVFQASIQFMNQVNSILKKGGSPNQFTIFSAEQSYYEAAPLPVDYPADTNLNNPTKDQQAQAILTAVHEQKKCLSSGSLDKNNPWCPNVVASPPVEYGFVGPSCMAPVLYGANGYDYGYPQMYNLIANYNSTPTASIFPLPSQYATSLNPTPYQVWDAHLDITKKHAASILPSFLDDNKPYGTLTTANTSIYSPPTGVLILNDSIAQILANIITTNFSLQNYASSYPCVDTVTNPGSSSAYPGKIFFTVSGESYIYGNNKQFTDINSINLTLSGMYNYVNQTYTKLPKQASQPASLPQWPIAIWGFDQMCILNSQVCLPPADKGMRRHRM